MDIVEFETAVYGRQHRRAIDKLYPLLTALGHGDVTVPTGTGSTRILTLSEPARTAVYTRIAAAVTALFSDPGAELTTANLKMLTLLGIWLDNLFAASFFRSTDAAIRMLPGVGEERPEWPDAKNTQARIKFLVLFGVDTAVDGDLSFLKTLSPALRLDVFLRLMSSKPVATLRGQARREELVRSAGLLEPAPVPLHTDYLVAYTNAFMLCSYASDANRHAVKPVMVAGMRDWLLRFGVKDATLPATREVRDRPVMAVFAEVMHARHVQYRYFGQWLRQLRTRFKLVLVAETGQVTDENRPLFDDVFTFDRPVDGRYLKDVVDFTERLRPDLIFYPSVGMRSWGAALATLRLAPIQFTALGHSASTFCPTIDYYVIEQGYVSDPVLLSETVVVLPDSALRFERMPGLVRPAPVVRARPDPLRIGLPSNLLKLNPNFLSLLRLVRDRSPRRLEFHVFPNVSGLEYDAGRQAVQAYLPGARVYGMIPHARYLDRLNQCDLVFSPFPFGGLHSVVDSLIQGIPVLAMDGAEPHARTDALMLRLAGMPDWLTCRTAEQYVETALRLIREDETRIALSRQAIELDVEGKLFGDATTPLGTDIVDAVEWMYRNHEAIQADGRKAWAPKDRIT